MKIMMTRNSYEQWLEYRDVVKTFQQAIHFSLGVVRTKPTDVVPHIGIQEKEICDIASLSADLNEFTLCKFGKSINRLKCTEVDSSFLDEYKIFLASKSVNEQGNRTYERFITIHQVFMMADLYDIPDMNLDMFEKWMSINFAEFDKEHNVN